MENHSILALDLLYQLWKLLFELATAKMHGACYVSIITTLVIPTTRQDTGQISQHSRRRRLVIGTRLPSHQGLSQV